MLGGIGGGGDSGGGGGGIFGMLGSLVDPLGLFSGMNKSGDKLNQLFDPAGIFPGLKGEIDKTKGDAGDQAKIGKDLMSLTNVDTVEDLKKKKEEADASKKKDSDASNPSETHHDAAVTEVYLPSFGVDGQGGYSPQLLQALINGDVTGGLPVVNQSAMTGITEAQQDELRMLGSVLANFSTLDGDYKDNKFDAQNLAAVLDDPNRFPSDLVDAATYLLSHRDVLNQLINLSATGNACITPAGIGAYVEAKKNELLDAAQSNGTNGTGGNTGTPPGPGTVGGPPAPSPYTNPDLNTLPPPSGIVGTGPKTTPPPGSSPTPNTTVTTQWSPPTYATPRSFDEMIRNYDMTLAAMDQHMFELGQKAIDDPKAQAELSSLTRRYQKIMELKNEMHTLLSNLQKSFHEMSMHSIGNIR